MIKAVISLSIWMSVSCSTNAQNSKVNSSNKVLLDTSQYAVIKYGTSEWIPFENVRTANLTKEEIDNMESIIVEAINEHNETLKNGNFKLLNLENYKRQYVAVFNNKGQKVVWVNFFCVVEDKRWRKEIIVVEDGGECFFNLKVNLSTKTAFQLIVNGYA